MLTSAKSDNQDNMAAHERYVAKLWPGTSHNWAIDTCKKFFTRETKILDIGPGSGVMGQWFKEQGCEDLTAVEIELETRVKLAGIYHTIVGNLSELKLEESEFNLVLLLDVLEHMADPKDFIDNLLPYLSQEALILISVPNITHWAVRLMVLCGYFEPMERGPLDKTHLQFFSRRRFKNFLNQFSSPAQQELSATIVPLELMLPSPITNNDAFRLFSNFRLNLAKKIPGIFAYQHLAAIRIKRESKCSV
jgi:ubiquinone/menaquinone biosynthesis C-methylase UbiE